MTSVLTASKAVWVDLADSAGSVGAPRTVQGMVELFGGGKAGVSALARELAAERGTKYASARRNVERYVTERGTEKRTPKRLIGDLDKIANKQAGRLTGERILDSARHEGGVRFDFAGDVRISDDERYRQFTVVLSAEDLAPFIAEAGAGNWPAAAGELEAQLLDTWDQHRGGILRHGGHITDVDEIETGYGG